MQSPPIIVEPWSTVRTPSGALAEVVAVYHEEGEALVRWVSGALVGQTARFRIKLLRSPGE